MATYVVIGDTHARPGFHNKRAEWLGRLILDIKPEVVVNIGDGIDFESLCSYDRGTKAFEGRTYKADIDSHLDFQDRLWSTVKKQKKALPRTVYCVGNHCNRVNKAISTQRELDGLIGLKDLELDRWYDDTVPYNGTTPGVIALDGIAFAHYLISGTKGQAIAGENHARTLILKGLSSCVVGHSHTRDFHTRTNVLGKKMCAVVVGCYFDHEPDYAGNANQLWWRGITILRNVEDGYFDPQFISLESIKKEYS